MAKYRRKPVVVEVELFREIKGVDGVVAQPSCVVQRRLWRGWWIETLEGWERVLTGDRIITGEKGEKNRCRPDIFKANYEAIEGD